MSALSAKAQYFLKTTDHFLRKLLISDHLIEMCAFQAENLYQLKLNKDPWSPLIKSPHKVLKHLNKTTLAVLLQK